jgi:glycosyltransferase involved in cell wall biosynthesis
MLSVIICTHKPRLDLLAWTLSSIAAQSLPREEWELIIVDNCSIPPLDLSGILPERLFPITKLISEAEPGLSAARCAGINVCRGEIIVFVDDDNHLAPDYLAAAQAIAKDSPELGCFGGKATAHFECMPSDWLRPLINNLGIRDYGEEPIISRQNEWGPWEPIGAGMVVRRAIGISFADFYRHQAEARLLGRKGDSLASCEDSLFSHLSIQLGFANAYHPNLKLIHFIKDSRVLPSYLSRLMLAMGGSYCQLQKLKGRPGINLSPTESARHLIELFSYRLKSQGDHGYIQWLWDVGHMQAYAPQTWPRISIIVPTFNSAATLRRTMESLKAQAYPALEIIIQDGGSTDETLRILEDYKSLITHLESGRDDGQSDAINRGFGKSHGDIEAWLCSDDEYRPGVLFYIALHFLVQPETEFIAGGCLRVFPDGSQTQVRPTKEQLPTLGYHNFIDQPSTFWRRKLRERAGPLDKSLHYAFDWEYWNRFMRHGATPLFAPEILSVYYFSDSNKTSIAGSRQVPDLIAVVKKYGPLHGRLARIYHFLYRNFDLSGCYDSPPTAPASVLRKFHIVLNRLTQQYGADLIHAYNWSYASKQQRGKIWYR